MRKLSLLKTIVDYIWIISIVFYPLIIIVSVLILIDSDMIDIPLKISGSTVELNNIGSKFAFIVSVANFGLILYAFYNFKKLLNNFKGKLIFEMDTCLLLDKIGKLIIYASFVYLFAEVILRFSQEVIAIEFGYGPFLYSVSLGLFFKVLSEVFKMGMRLKEENELTV